MIDQLKIEGFKRFVDQSFDLKPLTVLAGVNGTGKTSVIHSLLLAKEASQTKNGIVKLNGPYGLELGGFTDVINTNAPNDWFSVSLKADDSQRDGWHFTKGETGFYVKISKQIVKDKGVFGNEARAFQYLSADRWGPRVTQASSALHKDTLEVGCHGEYSAQVMDTMTKFTVIDGLSNKQHPDNSLLLRRQAELWLGQMTRPLQIDTAKFAETGITALKFRTAEEWSKPTNMGFGMSYALPIILAGLTAPKGGLVIFENPEAHLHPRGQSQMGVFLATLAACGIQVVVETHSDHILNGIRRAIGETNIISANEAIVHFFDEESNSPTPLSFTDSGSMSSWPTGFFDQFQVDIRALSSVRRTAKR